MKTLLLSIGLAFLSSTAELIIQLDRLKQTLFICGNTWLIRSVM